MILKIRRYVEEREWWIIDNIARFNFGVFEMDTKSPQSVPDVSITDYFDDNRTDQKSIVICAGTARMNDGSEMGIEFDTMAYLCNDEGKTIEKIVANYNIGNRDKGSGEIRA